jgi:hypothetical protein
MNSCNISSVADMTKKPAERKVSVTVNLCKAAKSAKMTDSNQSSPYSQQVIYPRNVKRDIIWR